MANWWDNDPVVAPAAEAGGDAWWNADPVVGAPVAAPAAAAPATQGGFMPFLNSALASGLGLPVDAANAALGLVGMGSEEPLLGAQSIRSGMRSVGINLPEEGAQPSTIPEHIGAGVGGAVGFLPAGAGLVGAAARSSAPMVRGIAETLARPFLQSPAGALGFEALSGGTAGAGQAIGEMAFPDSPSAGVAGALLGGLTPAGVIGAARLTPTAFIGRAISGQIAPFTEAGAMRRAQSRMSGLVEDPDAALMALNEPTIGNPSLATRTGDPRLMGMERAVRDSDPALDLALRQQETQAASTLRSELGAPAQGMTSDAPREFIGGRVQGLVDQMNARTAAAMERAQQRVAQVEPSMRQSEASVIVREELENAYRAARAQERALWDEVPRDVTVPTEQARAAYAQLLEDTAPALRDQIADEARRFLGTGSNERVGAAESARNMHGIVSSLREDARTARAAGRMNRARMSDLLADAAQRDLDSVAEVEGPMAAARAFTRNFHETFSHGRVGRVLGSERTGGERVAPEMTLDTMIGTGGTRGAVGARDLSTAVGDTPEATAAMGEYIRNDFARRAIRDGVVDVGRARTFLRDNEEMLSRFPELRTQIEDVAGTQARASRTADTMGGRIDALRDPRDSASAVLLGARPGEEIRSILRSRDPQATAAQLARQASRDRSGAATLGLKGSLLDDLMSRARTTQFDEGGTPLLSGRALRSALEDRQLGPVVREILSPEEVNRTRRIAEELAKVERSAGRVPDVGAVMSDAPNSIISLIARTFAAKQGARAGAGAGGAALVTAGFFSRRMQGILNRLTNDRAEALIRRAIAGDKELFEALITPGIDMRTARRAERRVMEALTGFLGQQATDEGDPVVDALTP